MPHCRLIAASIIGGTSLCPGHTAAVRGRLVRMRVPIDEFSGDVLQILRTEYQPPSYPAAAERLAADAQTRERLSMAATPIVSLDPSAECECRHSLGAHVRGAEHECSFCSCRGFQHWINPDAVDEKPLYRDVAEALAKLSEQPGFRDLATKHLLALGRYGRRRYFAPHSILFDRGDAGDRVYLLLSGEVELDLPDRSQEHRVDFQPGDVLGTRAFLRGEHAVTIRALDDVYVLELTKKEIGNSFRKNPRFAMAFMRMIRGRMSAAAARQTAAMSSEPAA